MKLTIFVLAIVVGISSALPLEQQVKHRERRQLAAGGVVPGVVTPGLGGPGFGFGFAPSLFGMGMGGMGGLGGLGILPGFLRYF